VVESILALDARYFVAANRNASGRQYRVSRPANCEQRVTAGRASISSHLGNPRAGILPRT